MKNIKYTINEFNTLTGEYVDIEITEDVYNCYRRTGWNMQKNNQKHTQNTVPFSSLCGPYDINDNFTVFASEADNPEQICEANETREFLVKAIKKLPENERIVIELIFFKGFSAIETGKRLGISEQGVNKRKRSAFKKIKLEIGFGNSKNFPI